MLYPIGSDGYVINEAERKKVQHEYRPITAEVITCVKSKLGDTVRSVYIRGSVSVGRAIRGLSDIDMIFIVHSSITDEQFEEIRSNIERIKGKYAFVPFIDTTIITFDELTNVESYKRLQIYLKTQSYCETGEDVVCYLPKVKPNRELALYMYGNVQSELMSLRRTIAGEEGLTYLNERRPVEFWCVWLMRVLLRSGLGIVMLHKPVYSQDLQTCAEVVSKEFPEFTPYVDQALRYAIHPTGNRSELLEFIDEFVPQFIAKWETYKNNHE